MSEFAGIIPLKRLPKHMGVFDYKIPKSMMCHVGQLVEIPFRSNSLLGIIAYTHNNDTYAGKTKEITRLINPTPFLTPHMMTFIQECASVYGVNAGTIAMMFLPPIQKRSLAKIELKPIHHITAEKNTTKLYQYYTLKKATEHIQEQFNKNEQTILLCPRIDDVQYIKQLIPDALTWDATLSQKQKRETWVAMRNESPLCVGTRSAIQLPTNKKTHIIIIDEESQDHKNWDARPRYRTFDIAQRLPHRISIYSRTPRITTAYNIGAKHMQAIEQRPQTHIVISDIRKQRNAGMYNIVSPQLSNAITITHEQGKQTFLLIHKKDYAHIVRCRDCNHIFSCPTCLISLRATTNMLSCSHCSYTTNIPTQCTPCKGQRIAFNAPGMDQLAQEISYSHPNIPITTFSSGSDPACITNEPQIIIGTKAAIQFLRFKNIQTCAIIDIDLMLRVPEYNAAETTLALLNDMLYRSQTANSTSTLYIQTNNPDYPIFSTFLGNSYNEWYHEEINQRTILSYPPKTVIHKTIVEHENAKAITQKILDKLKIYKPKFVTLFPETANKKKRMAIIIKLDPHTWWQKAQDIQHQLPSESVVDIDPISMLS